MENKFASLLKTLKEFTETLAKSDDLKKWGFGSDTTPQMPTQNGNGAPKADMSAWKGMAAPASTQNSNWQTPTEGPNAGKNAYERFTNQGAQKSEYQLAKEEFMSMKKKELMEKEEKGVHGNVVSRDAASRLGISDAGRNIKAAKKAKEIGLYNKEHELKETAKRFHQKVLAESKAMPKPNLPKSELDKEEKGVHNPEKSTQFFQNGKADRGVSVAGSQARSGDAPASKFDSESGYDRAKAIHKEKLAELKAMPKPNLPKAEKKDKE